MIGESVNVNVSGGLNIPLPKMSRVKQIFDNQKIDDIPLVLKEAFKKEGVKERVKPGQVVAVGCGSRGIANIALIVRTVVQELVALGAKPFIFPCMGSHGAATAEGQHDVLGSYGITEEKMGVPIKSSMETVIVGSLEDSTPVFMDRLASEADGIVVINRIKPHTSFRGEIESGLTKMLSIGIGKIVGAATYHRQGMDTFPSLLPKVRDCNLRGRNILFGVAIIENAYDQTAHLEIVPSEKISTREPELQRISKERMPRLNFSEIDVLIIDEMGKNISGAGFDPNITGRSRSVTNWDVGLDVKKIVVLSLTKESHGNATGIGSADVITMRLYKSIDVSSTYANCITSMSLGGAAIPIVMNSDKEAISLAVKAVLRVEPEDCRVVRITSTLSLDEIEVSENLLQDVRVNGEVMEILAQPCPFEFDEGGHLLREKKALLR